MVSEWTSNDVPSVSSLYLYNRRPDLDLDGKRFGAAAALEAVVEHLNAEFPKPPFAEDGIRMIHERDELRTRVNALECDRDRLRRAHEIVEQERDQAREALAEIRSTLVAANDALVVAAESERDAWRARAVAAEARTTPAVTKAEIEKAIRGKVWAANREPNKAGFHRVHIAWATDSVWSLVSGADPAVFVVRESDLPDVERNEDGDWLCENTLVVNGKDTAEDLRGRALPQLKHVAMREAVARAIEAGQAPDPVEVKARELFNEAGRGNSGIEFDEIAPDHRGEYLRIARHVLGQEGQ